MNFVLERLKVQVLCLFGTLNAKKWANSPRFLSVRAPQTSYAKAHFFGFSIFTSGNRIIYYVQRIIY